jgi:putative hydrolase of the HAD superfamily
LPEIQLYDDAALFLKLLTDKGINAGLITDGRSITQRNKLKSLGLQNYFSSVIISEEFGSEKPCEQNFLHFEKLFPSNRFFYFGDNTKKDFIAPLKLGWKCVCMENRGENIHNQSLINMNDSVILLKKFNQILVS